MDIDNKQYFYYQKYSQLSYLKLWHNQRDLNKNLVAKIVENQLEYHRKYGEFTFPGSLVVVQFGDYYLIDGQHRLEALKILYYQYKCDIEVTIQIFVRNDKNQIDELYGMLNNINTNNCMVVDGKIDPDGEKLKQIKNSLKERYGYIIWDDQKQLKPYINTKCLNGELKNCKFFKIKTADEIINAIEKKNKNYSVVLKNINKVEYDNMIKLGGFVLQCKDPKARWVRTLF